MAKFPVILASVLFLAAFAFSDDEKGLGLVAVAVQQMCNDLVCVLPVVAMLMVIGAGVVYAAGQMMGAETRARANTWATAMLLGAIIGILIVVVAPAVLHTLWPSVDANACTCGTGTGGGTIGGDIGGGEDDSDDPPTG